MAFWGAISKGLLGLGKGLLGVGGGGGSVNIADILSNIGRVSGDAAGSVQQNRILEDQIQQGHNRDQLARTNIDIGQRRSQDQHGLQRAALLDRMGMDRAELGINAPMARTKQAAYGDALKNMQDVKIDFKPVGRGTLPQFSSSGGIRPSMYGENARAAGGELGRQALMALLTKSDIPTAPDVPEASPLIDLPELQGPRGSSGLEKTLGGVGLGGSILGGIGQVLQKLRKPAGA